jgi:hypothetical protein
MEVVVIARLGIQAQVVLDTLVVQAKQDTMESSDMNKHETGACKVEKWVRGAYLARRPFDA